MTTQHKLLIPVIGHENAGKSTLVDALIGGEYTQTEAVRCTLTPYRFTLYAEKSKDIKFQSISEVNKTISENNSRNANIESELKFNVLLRAPLVSKMMKNTHLEMIDLPGLRIDENNLTCVASDFIKAHWESFACVLVVLDATWAALF